MNYVSFQHKQVEAKINLSVSVKYFEKCHTHSPLPTTARFGWVFCLTFCLVQLDFWNLFSQLAILLFDDLV